MGDNRYPRPLAVRFWEKVDTSGECWPWMGYRMKRGVGYYRVDATHTDYTPRIAWELTYGPIPEGLSVLHTCDNPPCVRPGHLFLGTQLDNVRDMEQKGRGRKVRGEAHHAHKLTSDQVRAIRQLVALTSQQAIATLYEVTQPVISSIVRNKTWKHVEESGLV